MRSLRVFEPGAPSDWSQRLPVVLLSLVGCGIAVYLTLYQVGIVAHVWEPFFGDGSRVILKQSAVARLLPVPDAALGALAYLLEAMAECVGDRQRSRTWPAAVFVTSTLAAALAVAAIALVACQVFWFHAFCTLCLGSAACSLLIAVLVFPEARAAWMSRGRISRLSA